MRYFWIFLLICGVCSAETINEKYRKPTNKEYSNRAFSCHGLSFKDRPVEEFNNTIIIGKNWENFEILKKIIEHILYDMI